MEEIEIKCFYCQFICHSKNEWYTHLNTPGHQETGTVDSFFPVGPVAGDVSLTCRTVIGWEFDKSLSTFPERIIELFANFGFIQDIYFRRLGAGVGRTASSNITAVQVLMKNENDAVNFVDNWNSLRNIRYSAKFEISTRLQWEAWFEEIEWYEIMLRRISRHKLLLQKLLKLPAEQQLQTFIEELSLSEADKELRSSSLANLETFIRNVFPSCVLVPFGSYFTGLSSPDSSIDVYVDVYEDMVLNRSSLGDVMQLLYKEFMRVFPPSDCAKGGRKYKDVAYLRHRSIPIIRVVDKQTNVRLELSFNTRISVVSSKLIKFYLEFDPLVKPLVMLIRYWARYYDLVGYRKISNYGLDLMIIVLLNSKRVLPRVAYLKNLAYELVEIEGWNASFCNDVEFIRQSIIELRSKSPNVADLKTVFTMAITFFDFYGSRDLEGHFVCSLHGTLVSKSLLSHEDKLNKFLGLKTKMNFSKLCLGSLVIQDPFFLHVNVNCCDEEVASSFRRLCKRDHCKLHSKLSKHGAVGLLDIFT